MKKKTTATKKSSRTRKKYKPRTMKTEKEKAESHSDFMKEVDKELDALRQICHAIEGMSEEAKARTFNYLKRKYSKDWPSEQQY